MKDSNARFLLVCIGCGAVCAACFDYSAPVHRERPGNEKREKKLQKLRAILRSLENQLDNLQKPVGEGGRVVVQFSSSSPS